MGHRKKKARDEEVTLNVTAMLDMAFQLLAFFILTFRPPPVEGQVYMRMPPPQAVLGAGAVSAGQEDKDPTTVKPVKTLTITLLDEGSGSIKTVEVGVPTVGMKSIPYNELPPELATYFKGSGDQFEQVIIQATSTLHWQYVMQAMETCSKQTFSDGSKLAKLSFIAIPDK